MSIFDRRNCRFLLDGIHTTFHTLRHTHASILLASGMGTKEVAARLGHADEAVTLRLYAHVLPGRDQALADAFDRALS